MTTVDTTQVDRALDGIGTILESSVLEILESAAKPMETRARRNIAGRWYDTGATHDSLAIRQTNSREINVGVQTDYAKYGEFGTSRLAPRSFLRDAFRSQLHNAERAGQAALNRALLKGV